MRVPVSNLLLGESAPRFRRMQSFVRQSLNAEFRTGILRLAGLPALHEFGEIRLIFGQIDFELHKLIATATTLFVKTLALGDYSPWEHLGFTASLSPNYGKRREKKRREKK